MFKGGSGVLPAGFGVGKVDLYIRPLAKVVIASLSGLPVQLLS